MVLNIIVLLGIAYYLFQAGEPALAITALFALMPGLGLLIAIFLYVYLLIVGYYLVGGILIVLIAWNLIGNLREDYCMYCSRPLERNIANTTIIGYNRFCPDCGRKIPDTEIMPLKINYTEEN